MADHSICGLAYTGPAFDSMIWPTETRELCRLLFEEHKGWINIIHPLRDRAALVKLYIQTQNPVWIVPKKSDFQGNKCWRMVIDYRSLNEKTIGDAYPLPNITDILDQLESAKYFSALDLASGFHLIPMSFKDAPKTAFSTPYGYYQFKRMPFGLKNAPATFQRLMDFWTFYQDYKETNYLSIWMT